MRFKSSKKVQPELVASRDASRPTLTKVHLNTDTSQIEVTDSYMLARFPVELDEGDTTGEIPVDALKASRKPPTRFGEVSIHADGDVKVIQGDVAYITIPRDQSPYQFPNAAQLFPDNLAPFRVAFSAKALYNLAKAMGDERVVLQFTAERQTDEERENGAPLEPSNMRPITVRPLSFTEGEDADGILMPIRISS